MTDNIDSVLLDTITKAVAFFDSEGFVVRANRAWDFFWASCSKPVELLVYADLLTWTGLSDIGEEEMQETVEVRACDRDLIIMRCKFNTEEINGTMVEIEDVSHIKSRSLYLARINSDVAGKLRTHIAAMENVLSLLIDYGDTVPRNEAAGLLGETRQEVWRLTRLLDMMRDATALNSGEGKLDVNIEKVPISELIDEIIADCNIIIPESSQNGKINTDVDPALCVMSDRSICRKAISAILFNALHYSDAASPVKITATCVNKTAVHISVEDAGWGIPDGEQFRVFDYGFRGVRAKGSDYSGLGIELHIVRNLLNFIHAGINFVSKENHGTRFEIIIRNGCIKKEMPPKQGS